VPDVIESEGERDGVFLESQCCAQSVQIEEVAGMDEWPDCWCFNARSTVLAPAGYESGRRYSRLIRLFALLLSRRMCSEEAEDAMSCRGRKAKQTVVM
jgi:hypothetical protein